MVTSSSVAAAGPDHPAINTASIMAMPMVAFALGASAVLFGMEESVLGAANQRADSLNHTIRTGQGRIFAEDQEILERQQANLLHWPERQLLKLNIDAGGVQSRRVIERLPVDLPRPRERAITSEPRFVAIKKYCLDLLRLHGGEAAEAPLAA